MRNIITKQSIALNLAVYGFIHYFTINMLFVSRKLHNILKVLALHLSDSFLGLFLYQVFLEPHQIAVWL